MGNMYTKENTIVSASGQGQKDDPYIPNVNIEGITAESNGALPVNIQDQTTEVIDLQLMMNNDTFTLASPVAVDSRTLTAVGGHTVAPGETVCIQEGTSVYQAKVLTVVTNTITVDTPFDHAFTTLAFCCNGVVNLAVDGSVTPQIFRVTPANLVDGTRWDIVRIIIQMTDGDPMDSEMFGSIAALTNGIVLRKVDGTYKNIFNVKTNGEFALRTFDVSYAANAPDPPSQGAYGIAIRRTFGGPSKNGVVIRLDATGDDELQIIVQDNLTGINKIEAVAQGHYVSD